MLTAADRHHNIKILLFLSPPQVIVRRSKLVFYLGMIGKKVKVALSQCAPTGYFQPWPDIQETTIATIAVLRHNSPVHCDVSSCTICAYLPQITGLLWLQVSSRLWLSCSGSNNGNYEKYSWHWLYSFLMRYDHDVMAGKTTGFYLVHWTRHTVCTPHSPNSCNRWVTPALTQTITDRLLCLFLLKLDIPIIAFSFAAFFYWDKT